MGLSFSVPQKKKENSFFAKLFCNKNKFEKTPNHLKNVHKNTK